MSVVRHPERNNPFPTGRETVIEARVEHVDNMLHRADIHGFTILSDEPERIGGEDLHPYPLSYFSAAVGFCLLTQLFQFGKRLGVTFRSARVTVRVGLGREGSVKQETVRTYSTGVETDLEVNSDDDPALVAKAIRIAKAGCFVEALLTQPVEVRTIVSLNGQSFDYRAT